MFLIRIENVLDKNQKEKTFKKRLFISIRYSVLFRPVNIRRAGPAIEMLVLRVRIIMIIVIVKDVKIGCDETTFKEL